MKPRLATVVLVQKLSLSCQLRLQFKNEVLVGNCGFSSKMKPQLPTTTLTKITKNKIKFNDIVFT